jgi:formate dehydrogenase iron-sulfur subunit
MSLGRRNFFKVLGVTGVSLAIGNELKAKPKKEESIEFSGVLYDSTLCVGCQTCETSCAEAHGLPDPVGVPDASVVRQADDKHRTVVNACKTTQGESYVKKQCMHCNEPACAAACLTQALLKTKEGPVIWREDKCMGCRYCMVSCPYNSPKFEYNSQNPKIVKCDMCYDKIQEGNKPVCVSNCPAGALVFGTRRELIREARKRIIENPGKYVDYIYGEHEAGGTGCLYLSAVPMEELGLNTKIQSGAYPEMTKGFLYSVPSIFVLWPAILLGIREATKDKQTNEEGDE